MANRQKVYFLCPTWDYAPDGPIKLGNIVMSADTVGEPLNFLDRIPPPASSLFPTTSKTAVEYSPNIARSGRVGVWTKFLSVFGIGADLGLDHASSRDETFTFQRLETTEFIPPEDYLQKALSSPDVVAYIEKQRFRKAVFMVTAIKAAYGVTGKTTAKRRIGGEAKLSVDGTPLGFAPVSIGPEVAIHKENGEIQSFTASSDFVFAFRLRKILIQKGGRAVQKSETHGAMYDAETKVGQRPVSFDILGLEQGDSSARDHDCNDSVEACDEVDDEACQCISLSES